MVLAILHVHRKIQKLSFKPVKCWVKMTLLEISTTQFAPGCKSCLLDLVKVGIDNLHRYFLNYSLPKAISSEWFSHNIWLPLDGILFYFFIKYFFFERERQGASRGEAERVGIPSRLQALSCQCRALPWVRTPELWDHYLSRSQTPNRLSHPSTLILYILDGI